MKNQSWSAYAKISFIQTQNKYNVKIKKSNRKYTALCVRAIELKMSKRKEKRIRGNWSQITCNLGLAYIPIISLHSVVVVYKGKMKF